MADSEMDDESRMEGQASTSNAPPATLFFLEGSPAGPSLREAFKRKKRTPIQKAEAPDPVFFPEDTYPTGRSLIEAFSKVRIAEEKRAQREQDSILTAYLLGEDQKLANMESKLKEMLAQRKEMKATLKALQDANDKDMQDEE
jgi:hypothetical protein